MKGRLFLVGGFLAAIALGTFLLMLPASHPEHVVRPFGDALFTACSAVCITGLTVVDVAHGLSRFGQGVLLALVQLGCVGIMTLGTFFLVALGRRLSLSNEFSLSNAYGTTGVRGLRGLVLWVVLSMFFFEAVGATLLNLRLHDGYRSYFYAVMSYCNAGFSLDPDSIAVFGNEPLVLVVMGCLTIVGGLGFFVVYNIFTIRFWRRGLPSRGRLTLHTRTVLVGTFGLLLVTALLFLAFEWNGTLAAFPGVEKGAVAFFQSVTPRTCGFTVVPVAEMHPATRLLSEILMFIGAAPGGAGGGVKLTTLFVFFAIVAAMYRGRSEVTLSKRTLPADVVRESLVVIFFFAALIAVAMMFLLATESGRAGLAFENLLYETVSAVTTTGLTVGDTTSRLSDAGRVVIMVCMFFGRLGALTVVLLVAGQDEPQTIRYPKEDLVIG